MILQNISKAIREQNYYAVALEFVIVIAGVVIGFQIQAWNEGRADKLREQNYLERLIGDFQRIDERNVDAREVWAGVVMACARVMEDLETYNQEGVWHRPEQEILADLANVAGGRIPAARSETFTEMLSTGDISLISNRDLRDALLSYNTQAHIAIEAYRVLLDRSGPYVAALQSHVLLTVPEDLSAITTSGLSADLVNIDLPTIAGDPEVMNALSVLAVAALNHLALTGDQIEQTQLVLDALLNEV